MGITLATIFTMLRLANEAKMRQVICSGACLTWACGSSLNQREMGGVRCEEGDKGLLNESCAPIPVTAQSHILFGSHPSQGFCCFDKHHSQKLLGEERA